MKKIEKNWAEKGEVTAFDRFDDVYQKFDFTNVKSRTLGGEKVLFEAANEVVLYCSKIKASAGVQINRFSFVHPLQQFDDFSYAIDQQNIAQDFSDKNYDCINKSNGNIVLENLQITGYQAITTILKGTTDIQVSIPIGENDAFYGLGDKTGNLNLRGSYYSNWCTDAFAADKKSNELYRAIPFFAAQTDQGAYGIFLDNTFRTYFDFGKTNPNLLTFGAEGGVMDFYVIQATDILQVIQNYTRLTGTPELPPIWALGYHQCRWSYFPENRVREVAQTFRDLKIPCDSLYLDIDYMDKYQCFTVNKTYFPDLKRLIADLKKDDFETVVMIDCGIFVNKNYPIYIDGVKENIFLKRGNGELAIAPVWPEKCVFPDYSNPKVREWWSNLHKEFCKDLKISGFWNDMNEPAVFNVKSMSFLEDLQHDFDGKPCNHAKAHNIYGMQMSRSSLEGMKKFQPTKRPFLLTRATFSGGQRYASIWTGDNVSDWVWQICKCSECPLRVLVLQVRILAVLQVAPMEN
jgi:alpha-glucosidase